MVAFDPRRRQVPYGAASSGVAEQRVRPSGGTWAPLAMGMERAVGMGQVAEAGAEVVPSNTCSCPRPTGKPEPCTAPAPSCPGTAAPEILTVDRVESG